MHGELLDKVGLNSTKKLDHSAVLVMRAPLGFVWTIICEYIMYRYSFHLSQKTLFVFVTRRVQLHVKMHPFKGNAAYILEDACSYCMSIHFSAMGSLNPKKSRNCTNSFSEL